MRECKGLIVDAPTAVKGNCHGRTQVVDAGSTGNIDKSPRLAIDRMGDGVGS